jgi:hypothetical protein
MIVNVIYNSLLLSTKKLFKWFTKMLQVSRNATENDQPLRFD